MIGTWRWNLYFGLFGALLIFLVSLTNNPMSTSFIRCLYAFVTFFIITFPFRFVIAYILNPTSEAKINENQVDENDMGSNVNLVTPDEGNELNEVLKSQIKNNNQQTQQNVTANDDKQETADAGFQRLKPPQLVSAEKMQPDELTRAIRHLTGE